MKNLVNNRHQAFKSELRKYHDSINRRNKYNLPKISGKLNVFEAEEDDDKKEQETGSQITKDRVIPRTGLVVLTNGTLQAIGDSDGKPLTDFKYSFIEGSFGDKEKMISCITDDGKVEYFDVEKSLIVECAGIGVGDIGVTDVGYGAVSNDSSSSSSKDDHSLDYDKVKDALMIPYLAGYRIKDVSTGRLLPKGIKRSKKRKHKKSRR